MKEQRCVLLLQACGQVAVDLGLKTVGDEDPSNSRSQNAACLPFEKRLLSGTG